MSTIKYITQANVYDRTLSSLNVIYNNINISTLNIYHWPQRKEYTMLL